MVLRPAFDSANSHFHVRYTSLDTGLRDNVNVMGFLRDDDRREIDAEAKHQIWFQNSAVENIEGKVNYNRYWSQEGVLRSWELETDVELVFTSGWQVELSYVDGFELFEKEYSNTLTSIQFGYDNRRGRAVFLEVGSGTNFGSDLMLATLGARIQDIECVGIRVRGNVARTRPRSGTREHVDPRLPNELLRHQQPLRHTFRPDKLSD